MRVLIVEDSLDDRTLLRYSLERHGCQVFEAGNGQEALELARKNPLELIISDALMPVMDGYELLRRLKKDATLKNIPFIFYSAVYTEVEEQELALMLGASAFVVKPLEPEIFWQRLQDILQEDGGQTKAGSADEGNDLKLLHKYGRIVAEKLEHKVRELARARDEWRRTFDAISDIVTVQDLDHRLLRVNQ
ncbi:MAG: response regulator, partial [Deltaproteobacteria bacterium]|nr:response regulator [Deltaproteobacteria bacterium]